MLTKNLERIKNGRYGKDLRKPIHAVLGEVEQTMQTNKLNRLIFVGELFNYIQTKTTNPEVIGARGEHDLLGNYLDEIDERLARYEKLLFANDYIPPENAILIPRSTVTFYIIREEA